MTMTPGYEETQAEASEGWIPADTFANRLRAVRHEKGLSSDAAAERCGLAGPTWRTWEKGASPQRMAEVVGAISEALGVHRDWLMWGQNWKERNPLIGLPTNLDPEPSDPTVPALRLVTP